MLGGGSRLQSLLVVALLLKLGFLGGGAFLLRDHHVLSLVALP